MTDRQMIDDIDRWSHDKLRQWFADAEMRYRLIGETKGSALSHVLATMMTAVAIIIARKTHIPAAEMAEKLAEVISEMRAEDEAET